MKIYETSLTLTNIIRTLAQDQVIHYSQACLLHSENKIKTSHQEFKHNLEIKGIWEDKRH